LNDWIVEFSLLHPRDRFWPIPPAGAVRFPMLPRSGPRRNADLRGSDNCWSPHSRLHGAAPIPDQFSTSRPSADL